MNTDIEFVKNNLIELLYKDPEPTDFPFLVSHPIFSYTHNFINGVLTNILEDKDKLPLLQEEYKGIILSKKKVESCFNLVAPPFLLTFFSSVADYLSEKDYSEMLRLVWTHRDDSKDNMYILSDCLLNFFRKANKRYLMTSEEREYLASLPKKVSIYRGVNSENTYPTISWTTDLNVAEWFAKQGNENWYILRGVIPKKDILSYFNIRGEKELIVDNNDIEDVSKMQQF